ncbi:hypothetical protein [Gordonia westfalica]|uniref:Uncharacterized protein n=1 Tax=Gordonia westfalica TaxID=158898 RepID=A0A1H2DN68_9ACTN|nr:hypothetical protein [Gordonia westfalica]SDT84363.1 hypothetical protein SAMN04488548_10827 [Gordonia westfalica]SDT86443.1 hypothetical protein SAMN04488548_12310 [Gordonia westfalica]
MPDGSTIVFDATKTYRLDPLSITGKSLTLDFNGARVVTKTMDSGDLSVASPFISWSSTVGPEVDLSSSGFARGATEVITNPFSGSNGFSTDDLVIVRDRYPVARWDTGANASWVGRGEVNIVQSITPSTGTVRLRIPLSHQYQANFSVVPTLQRISTPVRPVVKNIGLIIDTNPDGMYTGDIETSGGHLFYFYACVDPRVENVRAEGWENHIVNFNKCLRPRTIDIEGRNPFQTGSGHGYIGRMTHCVDGEFTRSVAYGTRHVANYVASARCGSRSCRSYRPAGVSYQTHGLRSRDIYSVDDTVVGGDSSGWSHGNTTYAGDYGYRILRPRYYGTNNGVLARCGSTGTRIIDPEIHTTAKGVEVSSLASDVIVDLTQGTIEIFGEAGTSYAVHAADVNGSGEYKPGSVTVHGPGDLVGTRALVSLDVTGAARIGGVEYDQGDDQLQRWDGTDWAEVESGGAAGVTLDTDQTITGAKSMAEVGFFGTSALGTKPSATDDLGTVLSSLGLRTAGGAYPITTSGRSLSQADSVPGSAIDPVPTTSPPTPRRSTCAMPVVERSRSHCRTPDRLGIASLSRRSTPQPTRSPCPRRSASTVCRPSCSPISGSGWRSSALSPQAST